MYTPAANPTLVAQQFYVKFRVGDADWSRLQSVVGLWFWLAEYRHRLALESRNRRWAPGQRAARWKPYNQTTPGFQNILVRRLSRPSVWLLAAVLLARAAVFCSPAVWRLKFDRWAFFKSAARRGGEQRSH